MGFVPWVLLLLYLASRKGKGENQLVIDESFFTENTQGDNLLEPLGVATFATDSDYPLPDLENAKSCKTMLILA